MSFDPTDAIAVLARTPATFRALLGGLPDGWTTCDEGTDTFTAFDNVGHLIRGERTDWIPRARIILAPGEHRRFVPSDRFAQTSRVMAKRYREEIGPWRAYLPVVTR